MDPFETDERIIHASKYSVYLLYWYKSTYTDMLRHMMHACSKLLVLDKLLAKLHSNLSCY
jgi:hypothetical protein